MGEWQPEPEREIQQAVTNTREKGTSVDTPAETTTPTTSSPAGSGETPEPVIVDQGYPARDESGAAALAALRDADEQDARAELPADDSTTAETTPDEPATPQHRADPTPTRNTPQRVEPPVTTQAAPPPDAPKATADEVSTPGSRHTDTAPAQEVVRDRAQQEPDMNTNNPKVIEGSTVAPTDRSALAVREANDVVDPNSDKRDKGEVVTGEVVDRRPPADLGQTTERTPDVRIVGSDPDRIEYLAYRGACTRAQAAARNAETSSTKLTTVVADLTGRRSYFLEHEDSAPYAVASDANVADQDGPFTQLPPEIGKTVLSRAIAKTLADDATRMRTTLHTARVLDKLFKTPSVGGEAARSPNLDRIQQAARLHQDGTRVGALESVESDVPAFKTRQERNMVRDALPPAQKEKDGPVIDGIEFFLGGLLPETRSDKDNPAKDLTRASTTDPSKSMRVHRLSVDRTDSTKGDLDAALIEEMLPSIAAGKTGYEKVDMLVIRGKVSPEVLRDVQRACTEADTQLVFVVSADTLTPDDVGPLLAGAGDDDVLLATYLKPTHADLIEPHLPKAPRARVEGGSDASHISWGGSTNDAENLVFDPYPGRRPAGGGTAQTKDKNWGGGKDRATNYSEDPASPVVRATFLSNMHPRHAVAISSRWGGQLYHLITGDYLGPYDRPETIEELRARVSREQSALTANSPDVIDATPHLPGNDNRAPKAKRTPPSALMNANLQPWQIEQLIRIDYDKYKQVMRRRGEDVMEMDDFLRVYDEQVPGWLNEGEE